MDKTLKYILMVLIGLSLFLIRIESVSSVFTINDKVNITGNLTVMNLSSASCDVKATTLGILYCGIDVSGSGGTGNTTAEMRAAINQSLYYNLTANDTRYFSGYPTGFFQNGTDIDTANTTTQMRDAVNQTLYYNFTSKNAWWIINSTLLAELQSTFNVTINTYMVTNVSSISNNTLFFNGLNTGYFQNGTETDTANTTTQMRDAINQSLYYNFSSADLICTGCIGSVEITGLNVSDFVADLGLKWSNLTDYPAACSVGSYISALLDTPTCTVDPQFNATLHNAFIANVSSISNNTLFFNGYPTGFFQNGTDGGGGSSGVNYWQVSGVWMWNNATSGGQPNSNFTSINATTIYENSVSLINKYVTVGNLTVSAGTIDGYDSAFFMPLNVSGLNTAWTSKLGFGNITDYNLDVAWRNKLEWGNISNDPQYNATVNTFITKNVSSISNNSLFFAGYPTGFFLNGTDIDTANTTAQMRAAINQSLYYNMTVNDTNYFKGYTTGFFLNGTDIDTANTTEQMQDAAGALLGGTETLITVTYDDANNDIDFVVNNDLHSYSWTNVVDADITNTLTASDLVAASSVVSDSEVDNAITINGAVWINTSTGMKVNDDVKFYLGTDQDVFIQYNTTASAGQLG